MPRQATSPYLPQLKTALSPYKVVAVGKNAFQYSEATSVTLPSTVTELMDGAFNASDIISINLGTGIEKIGENAFGFSREIEQISELPACLKEIKGGSPFNGNFKLKEIKVSPDNKWFKSVDGVLYNKKRQQTYFIPVWPQHRVCNTGRSGLHKFGCIQYISGNDQNHIPKHTQSSRQKRIHILYSHGKYQRPAGRTHICGQ